ncbi:LOW QUALITY PROTEIN: hypothetical protein Cgig2_029018 [Carnegiea gigantea]|uniref:Uncharacterized protein n=1 Tax=Carnegiea gigantea TaxID=171969 RepID=A0A9Q1GXH5_9CARY|nr:LOW QUALITY PROTEIN: hypothetical protein Cgig2_029018 [Carnegiea gigantea]
MLGILGMCGSPLAPSIPLYKGGAGSPTKGHLKALSNLSRERERLYSRESHGLPSLSWPFPPFGTSKRWPTIVRETFRWHWRSAPRSPRPLLEDYWDICPRFTLSNAEEVACAFELPEMATFYAILLNDAVEVGIASRFMAVDLKATLEGLWRGLLEAQLHQQTPLGGAPVETERKKSLIMFPNFLSTEQEADLLPKNHHGLYPNFDLLVAMWYAHNFRILEMRQAIFYAKVLNDVVELGLSSRIMMNYMMSVLRELNWAVIESWLWGIEERLRRAQIPRLVDLIANLVPAGGLKKAQG